MITLLGKFIPLWKQNCNSDISVRTVGPSFNAAYIHIQNVHSVKTFTWKAYTSTIFEIPNGNVHHLQMHKGQTYIIFMFLFEKIDLYSTAVREREMTGGGSQQEFTRPVRMLLGVLRYWALVLVTAPCFCRRWSLSWLLCLKWRSHFSHWGKKENICTF